MLSSEIAKLTNTLPLQITRAQLCGVIHFHLQHP